ncbi:MAG: DNA polymerase III subunit [Clostridia bacterium]|nr:DNA polymerase III subunit [Clostridia bacterium]
MFGYEIFHEDIMETIIASIRSGKNPHAYIFEGDAGLGKHTAACLAASTAVCENPKSAPCGTCRACVMAKAGTHPDIKHVVPEEKKKTIGVGVIRELNADAYIRPFYGGKKVYILEGDLMTGEAQNAFLKTLEEPPLYALFIIVASDLTKMLQTVVSRCACVRFPPLSKERMRRLLEAGYPALRESYPFYISFAEGNPGRLDSLLKGPEFSLLRDDCFKAASRILSRDKYDAFFVSEFFDGHKEQLPDILDILLLFFRDVLMLCEGQRGSVINVDYMEKLKTVSGSAAPERVLSAAERIPVCGEMIKRNVGAKYIGMYLALGVKEDKQ